MPQKWYNWAHATLVVVLTCCLLGFAFSVDKCGAIEPTVKSMDELERGARDALDVKDVFSLRVTDYRAGIQELRNNIVLQALFFVVGLGALAARGERFALPMVGYEVPVRWSYYILAIAGLYLWLDFGFLVDDLIESRVEVWKLLCTIGNPKTDLVLRNAARLFEDGGFLDGWFVAFREEHVINNSYWGGRIGIGFFAVVYGVLLGACHAGVFTLLAVGYREHFPRDGRCSWAKGASLALPWCAAAVLVASHIQFRYGGINEGWFQLCVAGAAVGGVYGLLRVHSIRLSG